MGLLPLSVYSGYFGAGSGMMILTLLLFTTDSDLPKSNALKNMLIGAAAAISAIALAALESVDWAAVAPLSMGSAGRKHTRPARHTARASRRLALGGRPARHSSGHSVVVGPQLVTLHAPHRPSGAPLAGGVPDGRRRGVRPVRWAPSQADLERVFFRDLYRERTIRR